MNKISLQIPGFSKEYIETSGKVGNGWDWEKALTSGIAFPYVSKGFGAKKIITAPSDT